MLLVSVVAAYGLEQFSYFNWAESEQNTIKSSILTLFKVVFPIAETNLL